jgi:ketosteroid isomerase-like protein
MTDMKKNGFNIMFFVIIIIFLPVLSCSKSGKNNISGVLIQADRDFSAMSVKEGMHRAFLYYVADDGVLLKNNSFPIKGKEALIKNFAGKVDSDFILSWEPQYEKISRSGEMGYTYGIYTNKDKITGEITKGTYVTVWLKDSFGNWKFVLDTGTRGLSGLPE